MEIIPAQILFIKNKNNPTKKLNFYPSNAFLIKKNMPIIIKLLKQYLQKNFGEDPELTLLKQQLADWEKTKKPFKI